MFLGTITQGQTILHGQYFGGKSCTALVRTDGGPRYLCAACCPMELGPSDFILPTIKGARAEARGLKGGLGGRGPRRWGEWKGISYPWTCAVCCGPLDPAKKMHQGAITCRLLVDFPQPRRIHLVYRINSGSILTRKQTYALLLHQHHASPRHAGSHDA
jgi:hypothetical protein